VNRVRELGARGSGTGKVVIFTESLTTRLPPQAPGRGRRSDREITLFRGHNEGERAREALAVWERDVASASRAPRARAGRRDAARARARVPHGSNVFLSTEAGAKGLNLQFCETLINYDLPWNPQRIEQRIGRVHRYGQTRPITVINFLAKDNEADLLLFDILTRKLSSSARSSTSRT